MFKHEHRSYCVTKQQNMKKIHSEIEFFEHLLWFLKIFQQDFCMISHGIMMSFMFLRKNQKTFEHEHRKLACYKTQWIYAKFSKVMLSDTRKIVFFIKTKLYFECTSKGILIFGHDYFTKKQNFTKKHDF